MFFCIVTLLFLLISSSLYTKDFNYLVFVYVFFFLGLYVIKYIASFLFVLSSIIFMESFFFNLIYLSLSALGPHCCVWAFSSCGERGLLFVAVRGPLIAVASLVAEHEL